MIGLGIGYMSQTAIVGPTPPVSDLPYQRCYLTGYLKYGYACKIPSSEENNMNVKLIQGDDLTVQLAVMGPGNQELDYSLVTGAKWELKDGSGSVILSHDQDDGIYIENKIILVLQENETEVLNGTYNHQFTLYIGNSTATVIPNSSLEKASFDVIPK